jgi:hypothetical protein
VNSQLEPVVRISNLGDLVIRRIHVAIRLSGPEEAQAHLGELAFGRYLRRDITSLPVK